MNISKNYSKSALKMIEKTPLDLLKEPLTLLNLVGSLELCTWVLPSPDASSDIGDPKLWGLLLENMVSFSSLASEAYAIN